MSGSKANQPPPAQFNLLPKIINGGIAGIIGVSVVFPIDLVKTRLQNQTVGPNGERQYKNMLDCFKQTYRAEGYFGMYRGSAVNIILITPEKAIKLAANDMFRYHLTLPDGLSLWYQGKSLVLSSAINTQCFEKFDGKLGIGSLPIVRQMCAGAMAGACQIVITTPMELLKIQMQDAGRLAAKAKAEGKKFERITAMQLTRNLLKERGIFGLYQGVTSTAARDVSFSIVYFPMFATLNDFGPRENPGDPPPFWWSFISGCAAGSSAALIVNPLDVVKTRMQTITKGSTERQYSSIFDCVTKTLSKEGITAFFKGGACRMMVIAPLFGIAQSIYYIGLAENYLGIK